MNAINTDSIKIFIDANVYNAIQAKVVDLKWEKFKVEVKEDECKCGDQIIKGYSASSFANCPIMLLKTVPP